MKLGHHLSYSKELTPLSFIKMLLDSTLIIGVLLSLLFYFKEPVTPKYYVVIMIVFALSFPGQWTRNRTLLQDIEYVFTNWIFIAGLLGAFGYATEFLWNFPKKIFIHWLGITPFAMLFAHRLLAKFLTAINYSSYVIKTAVIVGVSDLGIQLKSRMNAEVEFGLKFIGFFDDRTHKRFDGLEVHKSEVLGNFAELARYVSQHAVDIIYIALPMTSQPRVMTLLDSLKDTTASIYFIPDVFMFDLIQARISDVAGIPVIAVCETPFSGMNGLVKRLSDIVISMIIMMLTFPIMLLLAIGVKLS